MKTASRQSPAALGFRLPAEWEPQEAVWLSWPDRRATWPGHFRPIPAKFAEVAAQISRREKVRINAAAALHPRIRALLKAAKADEAQVELFPHATDDAWCRDHGPIFVRNDRTGEVAATDWKFNAWGGKYRPSWRDDRVPARVAKALGMHRFSHPMVLEGGSIDGNGEGVLLTTEACLLNPNRNPDLTRRDIERNLREMLGTHTVLWLGEGIVGDDTDGHVDDLTRFFRADGIVTVVEPDSHDPNHRALEENRERLQGMRTARGRRFAIVELPMPRPCYCEGMRLPASYANFLILNQTVLMPAFRQRRQDAAAAEILAGCFPGRKVVPIDCVELVWGLGTLHCITQQQPAGFPAGVASKGSPR